MLCVVFSCFSVISVRSPNKVTVRNYFILYTCIQFNFSSSEHEHSELLWSAFVLQQLLKQTCLLKLPGQILWSRNLPCMTLTNVQQSTKCTGLANFISLCPSVLIKQSSSLELPWLFHVTPLLAKHLRCRDTITLFKLITELLPFVTFSWLMHYYHIESNKVPYNGKEQWKEV